jgi:hypothetical protein
MNNECDIFLKFSFRCLFCHRIRHGWVCWSENR